MFEIIESRWNNDYRVSIDTVGMDYESAVEAMPRVYGVSFGNGNDGVSHMFASYYVRTCEPFVLAAAAMLSEFSDGQGKAWAMDQIEIDGEADYTISAMVLNPPDDGDDYQADIAALEAEYDSAENEVNEATTANEAAIESDDSDDIAHTARMLEEAEERFNDISDKLQETRENDPGTWSDANGAWMICEVFPDDEPRSGRMVYDSLSDAFDAHLIEHARAI
jgi:hypothetical protein